MTENAAGTTETTTTELTPAELTIGQKVPDFSLRDLDGKTVKLSQLQKDTKKTAQGIVILSFWCSSCPSCRRSTPQAGCLW